MQRLLRVALALAIVLAGRQMAWAAEREKVDFGVGSAPGGSVYIQVDLAKALGYFAEEGLDLNLQYFKGGAVAGAALVGGSTDISANAIDHAIKAKQQGKELRFIVSFTRLPGTPLVVNTKYRNEIKSPKDLRGRPCRRDGPGVGHGPLDTLPDYQGGGATRGDEDHRRGHQHHHPGHRE